MKWRPIAERLDTGLNKYLAEIGRIPLLTAEQEHAVATKASNGDKAARDQMIHSNLRLVVTIAQDYLNLGLPLSDLISEGTMGLAKAVERFDPTKAAKLSTYAAWWIKQSIKLALSNQVKTVRLPIHLQQKIAKSVESPWTWRTTSVANRPMTSWLKRLGCNRQEFPSCEMAFLVQCHLMLWLGKMIPSSSAK